MEHYIHHVKPSPESPVLLLLDNHSSHLCVKTLDLARNNGIVMLSFPPHCSHKLQPLDVSVFGPFKRFLSGAQDGWMRSHPGKTMTIYDIPSIVRTALPMALSPVNCMKGFQATGVFPFNRDIFTDSDFAPSYVTDRPEWSEVQEVAGVEKENVPPESESTSRIVISPQPSTSRNDTFSVEIVRPFPKAGPRKITTRKRRKTAVLTDIIERDALASEQENSKKRKGKKIEIKRERIPKKKILQDKEAESVPEEKKRKGKKIEIKRERIPKKKILQDKEAESVPEEKKRKGKKIEIKREKIPKKKILQDKEAESVSEEEDCLVCCEAFSESKPGEGWIQCGICKGWAHDRCAETAKSDFYVCVTCNSDGSH